MNATTTDREQQLLRMMRPPELRDVPDALYQAVAAQAKRIAKMDYYIRRTRWSIERARRCLEAGTWPNEMKPEIDWSRGGRETDKLVPVFDEDDTVTVCWMIDIVAGELGWANLHAVHKLAKGYRILDGRSYGWNQVTTWSLNGSVRSNGHAGLLERVAPVTWKLTDSGRELLAVVFGDEDG